MNAKGRFDNGDVIIDDEAQANRLYNKGFFGTPESGNSLRLHAVEACYAMSQERLQFDVDLQTLLRGKEVQSIAYNDFRNRGLVIRPDGDGFHVWQRGEGPPSPASYRVNIQSERHPVNAQMLWDMAQAEDVLSIVDDDATVTHYRVQQARPKGSNGPVVGKFQAEAWSDRVKADAGLAEFGFGTAQGALWLSQLEADYLQRLGVLQVAGEMVIPEPETFAALADIYADLRARGTLPRSGYRFGTHLRAYEGDMNDHAPWLVDYLGSDANWSGVSRGVRLAHGVRKQFLLALTQPVRYIHLQWIRP